MKIKTLSVAILAFGMSVAVAKPICELPWNANTAECKKWREHVKGNWQDGINSVAGYEQYEFTLCMHPVNGQVPMVEFVTPAERTFANFRPGGHCETFRYPGKDGSVKVVLNDRDAYDVPAGSRYHIFMNGNRWVLGDIGGGNG
jgi:hypothetical protein